MMIPFKDKSIKRYSKLIKFTTVQDVFKNAGIRSSPLLFPVTEIEKHLRDTGYLREHEFLLQFDPERESFIIVYDEEIEPKKVNKFRLWLAKIILPK